MIQTALCSSIKSQSPDGSDNTTIYEAKLALKKILFQKKVTKRHWNRRHILAEDGLCYVTFSMNRMDNGHKAKVLLKPQCQHSKRIQQIREIMPKNPKDSDDLIQIDEGYATEL